METKIKKALDKVRPALQMDGGDIEFVNFDEKKGILAVKLLGMCASCPMSEITLKEGIETELKNALPEIKEVRAV